MTVPWLFCFGYITIYGALFAKLWRINQVLQIARRTIKIRQVAWPCLVLVLIALIILSLWTAIDPLWWTRMEINEDTGESIGSCWSDNMFAFLTPLIFIMLIPTVLTVSSTKPSAYRREASPLTYLFFPLTCYAVVDGMEDPGC